MSRRPEDMLQKACIKWLYQYFALRFRRLLLSLKDSKGREYDAVPIVYTKNEGKKNIVVAMEDKRMGLTSGFCDLTLHVNNGVSIGLVLELKSTKGTTRHNQKEWQRHLREQGFEVHTNIRTLDEFIEIVMAYMAKVKG